MVAISIKSRLLDVVASLNKRGTAEARVKGEARIAVMLELYGMGEAELRASIEESFGIKTGSMGVDDLRIEAHRLVIEHLKTIYSRG